MRRANTQLLRQLADPSIEFRDRLAELLLPGLVRGQLQLALHLCTRQTARLELARELGIAGVGRVPRLLLFLFSCVHPLGESGFRTHVF